MTGFQPWELRFGFKLARGAILTQGKVIEKRAQMNAKGKRFGVVVSRWNELITEELLRACVDELERHGAEELVVVRVPGTWEIPAASRALILGENRPHAIVALGCILMGQTAHAKLLNADVGAGLMQIQTETGVPISWGILTPDDMGQAYDRTGLKLGNKGREAALAAIEMADLVEKL